MSDTEGDGQPPIGGFCETCGHFAGRHTEDGCQFPGGCKSNCSAMKWLGVEWPRPWLPAPDGKRKALESREVTDPLTP